MACFVCKDTDRFTPAAACQHLPFLGRIVLWLASNWFSSWKYSTVLLKVHWNSLALLENASNYNQNIRKECHKIVNIHTLEKLNTLTTWNDMTHAVVFGTCFNDMTHAVVFGTCLAPSAVYTLQPFFPPQDFFLLTYLPLEKLNILNNHLFSFQGSRKFECDTVQATGI